MKIAIWGLGKLGLPVALAIASKGHEVKGYDINEKIKNILSSRKLPYNEPGAQKLLEDESIKVEMAQPDQLVGWADIIFVAVQTPHKPEFEGITRLPEERQDFDYKYLKKAINDIDTEVKDQKRYAAVIVISTVLPGTMRREIMSFMDWRIAFGYNPFFIAMGTVVEDFLNPEFVLLGTESNYVFDLMREFYGGLHDKPIIRMSIESAELTKVSYNTYITSKINIVNAIMEISHKIPGCDCDEVSNALKYATDRIVSPKYMKGGMGDGGGCHPRDGIAFSWLARKLNLSRDIYEDMMKTREAQTEWLADIIIEKHKETNLPIIILGYSFKAGTNIVTGSAILLLMNMLEEKGIKFGKYDPYVESNYKFIMYESAIFFIGMNHDIVKEYKFPEGSIVIDPWRCINLEQKDVEIIRIGGSNAEI